MNSISASALPRIGELKASEVIGLAVAASSSGTLDGPMLESLALALDAHGEAADAAHGGAPPVGRSGGGCSPGARADEPCALHEGRRICVLWKPPGWTAVVRDRDAPRGQLTDEADTPQQPAGSLASWVAARYGRECPIAGAAAAQHGLVHRLDRETSGALLFARDYRGFYGAQLQFAVGRVRKMYVCLCRGLARPARRRLEAPLAVVRREDQTLQSVCASSGMPASTELLAVSHLHGPVGSRLSLVEVHLHTGRMHQIRAHLSGIGHALAGDEAYGGGRERWCARVLLHAHRIALHADGGLTDVGCPLPSDFKMAMGWHEAADARSRAARAVWSGTS